jgi:pyruvate formate lyase activating enzyme
MSGIPMTVSEIMETIEKERIFFEQSGGGVTFSGGEPLIQSGFLISLLDECGKSGIHRTVDTAGHVKTQTLLEVSERTDLFLFDLKHMDPALHKHWTGVGNELILHNLRMLSDAGADIIIRIPLIGGVNDDEENIRQTAVFLNGLAGEKKEVHLLPYHKIAETKYMKLGIPEDFELFSEPDPETTNRIIKTFSEYGITATVGG